MRGFGARKTFLEARERPGGAAALRSANGSFHQYLSLGHSDYGPALLPLREGGG